MKTLLMSAALIAVVMPSALAEVSIQNDQQYIGDDGSLHIVGEIVNNLQAPINQINVEVTLYDSTGRQIGAGDVGSMVNTIMPGMRGPFDLILPGTGTGEAESYSASVEYEISIPKNQVIDITESKLSRDSQNNLMITGIVANQGEITANTVSVVATLYDDDGNVAAVSRIHPKPDYLPSKEDAFFVVSVSDKTHTEEVREYSLIAESEEYAAVPEFPVSTIILLVGSLSVYIGVTRFSKGIIANLISAADSR